jgi:hypothetical protein
VLGSQRLKIGKAQIIKRKTNSISKKGITPFSRSPVEILKTLLMAKRLIPMGGVISPIRVTHETTRTNRIKPIVYLEYKNGTVNKVIERDRSYSPILKG